jgi:hypothetical protein
VNRDNPIFRLVALLGSQGLWKITDTNIFAVYLLKINIDLEYSLDETFSSLVKAFPLKALALPPSFN